MDYLYDGSFSGFLTCVYHSYKSKKASGIYEKKSYQTSLINDFEIIQTDYRLSDIVYNAIEEKISKDALELIYYAFLSCDKRKENMLLKFIEFGFKRGKIVYDMYSHDCVLPVKELYATVFGETHRFLGILRFSDIGGILYARYNPDNDITVPLTEHFSDRYKYEKFIIHDERRKIASVYAKNKWQLVDASMINSIDLSEGEIELHKLWKSYFTTLSIDERLNLKIQFQKVPVRYRKNIVEFTYLQDS